jgi:hypothetical protein
MLGLEIEVAKLWGAGKEHDVTMHASRRPPRGILSETFKKFGSIWA